MNTSEDTSFDAKALRVSLTACTDSARVWFLSKSKIKKRSDWPKNLEDSGIGAVYVFNSGDGKCLYVGQTTALLTKRAQYETANHYQSDWWPLWQELRFLNLSHQSDQLVLEMLLILALQPEYNQKPKARSCTDMFPGM